ncbi:hypothetical protein HMPREF9413_4106 [Paenibacillus sp. HGF7]|nr:hypothetical protein HMPREF9413_4106 [Paenibacillus sp. HGF7]
MKVPAKRQDSDLQDRDYRGLFILMMWCEEWRKTKDGESSD